MQSVRVAADRWNFEQAETGEPIVPLGGNVLNDEHPSDGTLWRHFDPDDCERRLAAMAGIGLNCLRHPIGVNEVFDANTGLKAEGLKHWDQFITLCEKYGIYLMPVGGYLGSNDWFDAEQLSDPGRPLEDSCRFWDAFAGHYRGHPAIWAWDLRNELLFNLSEHMTVDGRSLDPKRIERNLLKDWPAWLETRYGTVSAMNAACGTAHPSFGTVPGSVLFVEKPFDPLAFDFRNYLNELGYRWCRPQVNAIRRAAPGHMVVSGNNGWLFPDMDLWLANGFHNRHLQDLFDFVTFHPYPAPQCLPTGHGDPLNGGEAAAFWFSAVVAMARIDHYAKPVVVQEFGWYGGGASRFLGDLPYRSEEEHALYTRRLIDVLRPHANGFINWPTFDMPGTRDISNHGGIFAHDGRPKALAEVYRDVADTLRGRRQVRASATTTLTCSLLGLYTCRSYQDRMWNDIHAVVAAGGTPDFRFI